jgi:signal transduction histidine kinase
MTVDQEKAGSMMHLDQERLVEISRGLHQAAQPLTALQGWIELALDGTHSEHEYKSLMKRAREESQRVFGCFDRVRESARLQQLASCNLGLAASSMVRVVLERLESSFNAAGVRVVFYPLHGSDAANDLVRVPENQVSAALSLVISSLFPFLKRGDKIELSMKPEEATVSVEILVPKRARAKGKRDINWNSPLLEMARSLLVRGGGTMTFSELELSVQITLPKTSQTPTMQNAQITRCLHV